MVYVLISIQLLLHPHSKVTSYLLLRWFVAIAVLVFVLRHGGMRAV